MRTGYAEYTARKAAIALLAGGLVALLVCVIAMPPSAWADSEQADHETESVSFEPIGTSVFSSALMDLEALIDYGEVYREREEARYWSEQIEKRAERRAQWERVQAWRSRFPAGDYSDVLLLGDSIMDESRYYLTEAMPGCTVNADSGRTLEEGGLIRENADPSCGVLDYLRKDDGTYTRYVIGTGNNDAGGVSLSVGEEIVSLLGADKEIYFVTEMVTGNPWGTETTNATIDALVEEYPNVHKIDWHGFVEGREYELLRDVCHPNDYGKPVYTQVVKSGVDVCYAR